jgi:hypothetical protein
MESAEGAEQYSQGLQPLRGFRPGLYCVSLSALQSALVAEGVAQKTTSAKLDFHRAIS